MKRIFTSILAVLAIIVLLSENSNSEILVKIRDIAYIDGLKDNQVYGFGLVVGLQGTGDTKSVLIQSSLKNLLKNLGFVEDENFKSKNIAAVLLTAKLPPFVRVGDRVDITVSSIGNAKSLNGGILIQSPLRGADGQNYVVAQGPLSLKSPGRGGKDVKTVATLVEGGIVEKEIVPNIVKNKSVVLVLKSWDFSVANRIIKSIKNKYTTSNPKILKGGKINLSLPANITLVEFVSGVENIEIAPGFEARVVINESDGTIVMGRDVKISEAVVSKDGMTIKVEGAADGVNVGTIKEASTVKDLVESLNYVGASTRDIISILKALKDAGALHANLIIK